MTGFNIIQIFIFRAEKSKKESILLKRQKKKLKSLTPRKVKSLLFAKAPKKAQKASKSEVLLRGKYQAVHEVRLKFHLISFKIIL